MSAVATTSGDGSVIKCGGGSRAREAIIEKDGLATVTRRLERRATGWETMCDAFRTRVKEARCRRSRRDSGALRGSLVSERCATTGGKGTRKATGCWTVSVGLGLGAESGGQ